MQECSKKTAGLPEQSKAGFDIVHDYINAVAATKKLLHEEAGPFAESGLGKKNLANAVEALQEKAAAIKDNIKNWKGAASSGSKPFSAPLQKLSFKKDYLERILTSSDAILQSAAKQTVEAALRATEKAAGAVASALAAVPNPEKSEKKFLSYMNKQGTSINDLSKNMEGAYARALQAAKSCGAAIETLDTKTVGATVKDLKHTVLSLILTNSMVTLLRTPQITSCQRTRQFAQQVYSQFQAEEELVLLPKYEEEYVSNVGLPAVTAEAAAAEPAPRSPIKKKARR